MRNALLQVDSLNLAVIQAYLEQRHQHYERELEKIRNVTILDPDFGCSTEHAFKSACYQTAIRKIIAKYQMSG